MSGDTRQPTVFGSDVARSAIAIAVVGLASLGIQPVLVSGLIEHGHLSDSDAGYVAAAEVLGITATNALTAFAGRGWNWRLLCVIGLGLVFAGNIFSIFLSEAFAGLIMCRAMAGLGSGLLISRGYATGGLAPDPGRMFGYILAASTAQIALACLVLPYLVQHIGVSVIFGYLVLLGTLGGILVSGIPSGTPTLVQAVIASSASMGQRGLALFSAGSLFLGLGVLWPFLYQMGLRAGVAPSDAAIGLTVSQIAAFAGALLAALLVRWISRNILLMFGLIGTIASILFLGSQMDALSYGLAISGFNGLSNLAMPLVIAAVATTDTDGRLIAGSITLQTAGFAFGPALAALVVADGDYSVAQGLSAGLVFVSLLAVIIFRALGVRRRALHCT